jgi:hypothetical protein
VVLPEDLAMDTVTTRRPLLTLLAIASAILALAPTASAQYFGRNKVQHKHFEFQVLQTEHFDIYYYPSEQPGVTIAARLAERWHARFSRLFDHQLRGRQSIVFYGSHADFEQTNVIPNQLSERVGGVTEPLRRRIVLPLSGPLADTPTRTMSSDTNSCMRSSTT